VANTLSLTKYSCTTPGPLQTDKPSRYVTSHPRQLSLAILSRHLNCLAGVQARFPSIQRNARNVRDVTELT